MIGLKVFLSQIGWPAQNRRWHLLANMNQVLWPLQCRSFCSVFEGRLLPSSCFLKHCTGEVDKLSILFDKKGETITIAMFNQVKWYVSANHAGGYSYRLCKMPERGIKDLTEECFQVNLVVMMIAIIEIL